LSFVVDHSYKTGNIRLLKILNGFQGLPRKKK
jgi:hypothetical protein